MTGPDRIWIDRHGGNWSPVDGGTQDVEYIRRDPAVLASLPEVQALIAAAFEAAAKVVDTCNAEGPYQSIGAAGRIRALTPSDATAALASAEAYAASDRRMAQKTANDVVKWKARAEKAEARAVELEAALKSALNLWNRAEIQDGYILLWRDGDMIARLTFDMWNVGLEPCHQEAIVGDVLDAFQARATIKDVAK